MYIIFDQVGDAYEVELMEDMTKDMTLEELEECYKSSSYFMRYTDYLYSLHDEGKIKLPTKKFEVSQISDAVDIMRKRVDADLGVETRKDWDAVVEEQWKENKES
jgi:hypothetical protein